MSRFPAAWLALRAPADDAARDPALDRRFAAALPRPARIADLGAGTGANARALAPLIGGDQHWLLADADPALCAAQGAALLGWAQRLGHPAQAETGVVTVTTGSGRWRFAGVALDLAGEWSALDRAALDAVTCAALLDLASAAWIERLARWLAARRLPFHAALTVDGRRVWEPPAPEDAAVAAAFRRHQAHDKGLGPALGGAATAEAERCFAAQGFTVTTAASDWRLGAGDRALLEALVRAEAEAALEAAPGGGPAVRAWRDRRLAEATAATLRLTVGHCDLLALPR